MSHGPAVSIDFRSGGEHTDVDSNGHKKRRIFVHFRWYDGNDNVMNNVADTSYTGEDNTDTTNAHELLKYNVKVTFTQTF